MLQGRIYIFKAAGMADILMQKDKASSLSRMVSVSDDANEIHLKKVATTISAETKFRAFDQTTYEPITPENLFDNCSETLMVLLSLITPNLDKMLSAAMIGHIVHGAFTGSTSMLQLSIGHLLREKKLMERIFKHGISASQHEVRRFKISAAASEVNKDQKLNASDGLIHYISDTFDANISWQNGLQQTHGLASIVTPLSASLLETNDCIIKRISESTKAALHDDTIGNYTGPYKPSMPAEWAVCGVLPLRPLCQKVCITRRSENTDFIFIKTSLAEEKILTIMDSVQEKHAKQVSH